MTRISAALGLTALFVATGAPAADLDRPAEIGRFRATCEDLGTLCFADACGRDQIDAALACRALCPSSSVMSVVPARCTQPQLSPDVVLRRRG